MSGLVGKLKSKIGARHIISRHINRGFATSQDAQKRLEREVAQWRRDELNVFEDGKRNSNETLQTSTEIINDMLEDVTPKTNNVSKSQMLRNEDLSK